MDNLRADLNRLLHGSGAEIRFTDVWNGVVPNLPLFKKRPAIFGFGEGALPALARSAGINVLAPEEPTVFRPLAYRKMVARMRDLALANDYEGVILYFKDPDWASHAGDSHAKIAALEQLDENLEMLCTGLGSREITRIAVFSDHRTNIGGAGPSHTPSIFMVWSPVVAKGVERFTEECVEHASCNKPLLSMADLHQLIFADICEQSQSASVIGGNKFTNVGAALSEWR